VCVSRAAVTLSPIHYPSSFQLLVDDGIRTHHITPSPTGIARREEYEESRQPAAGN